VDLFPPVRTRVDNARLWEGLQGGTIQTIARTTARSSMTAGSPFYMKGNGSPSPARNWVGRIHPDPQRTAGVQDRLPVLWTRAVRSGRLTPEQFVTLTSTNPAKIFGLYPRKGSLVRARMRIWSSGSTEKVSYGVALSQQRTDYNLYEGWELVGYPEKVFLRGHLIVDGGNWLGNAAGDNS